MNYLVRILGICLKDWWLFGFMTEETEKWKNVTIAAYIGCIAMGIYTLSGEEHHGGEQPVSFSQPDLNKVHFKWFEWGLFTATFW